MAQGTRGLFALRRELSLPCTADVISEPDTAHFLGVPLSVNFGGCTFPDRISNSVHFLPL